MKKYIIGLLLLFVGNACGMQSEYSHNNYLTGIGQTELTTMAEGAVTKNIKIVDLEQERQDNIYQAFNDCAYNFNRNKFTKLFNANLPDLMKNENLRNSIHKRLEIEKETIEDEELEFAVTVHRRTSPDAIVRLPLPHMNRRKTALGALGFSLGCLGTLYAGAALSDETHGLKGREVAYLRTVATIIGAGSLWLGYKGYKKVQEGINHTKFLSTKKSHVGIAMTQVDKLKKTNI